MEDRDNDNLVGSLPIIDAVRKPFNDRLSDITQYDTVHPRPFRDSAKDLADGGGKKFAKARALCFVPIACLVEFKASCPAKNDWSRHCDHRAIAWSRTSSHGTVSSGFASSSAIRRSSSSR